MKKNYIKPAIDVYEMPKQAILAGSLENVDSNALEMFDDEGNGIMQ